MAHKRLSLEQVEQMKKMVQQSIAPEDIAKHFGIAISSVHNYKARFKAQGVNFPSIRGKRPTGSIETKNQTTPAMQIPSGVVKQVEGDVYKFIVNGTTIQISGHAKDININKDSMEINF